MFKHTIVYKNHFGLYPNEHHYCEICGLPATGGIHHIDGRGKEMDVINNLMGVCAEHHHMCEMSKKCNEYAKVVHMQFLLVNPYRHPETFKELIFKRQKEIMDSTYKEFLDS